MKSTVGKNIKRLRVNMRLTQDNMAYELGITKSSYSKIERGETNVSVDRLSQIAKVLEVDVADLFVEKNIHAKVEDPQTKFGFATKGEIEELAKMIHTVAGELTKLKTAIQTLQEQQKRKKK